MLASFQRLGGYRAAWWKQAGCTSASGTMGTYLEADPRFPKKSS